MAFLDFLRFGVPGTGGRLPARTLPSWIPLLTAASIAGCTSRPGQAPVEESLTAGRMLVVSAPEARQVMDRESAAFVGLYPQAEIRVVTRSSREVIRALFAAECDLALVSRELEPEERGAAAKGGLDLEGYRFAKDAVVVLVNPGNPVENLALDDLRRIYQGDVTNWSELGGPRRAIEPVFPDPASDMGEFFVQRVMNGEPVGARVVIADGDSATVDDVRSRPGGIGFVSLAWSDRGAKALRVSSLSGLPYWGPDLEAIHDGDYPLTRSLTFYIRGDAPKVAHGLITFATSREGQQIVHESGLVPTTVPVRFVRRSPMKGAHR